MKCNHDEISRLVEQDGMVADGFCPVCLQEQLQIAQEVVTAAENFLDAVDNDKYTRELYADILSNTIAKFKGGQDDE